MAILGEWEHGRQGAGTVAERSHLIHKDKAEREREKEREGGGGGGERLEWLSLLKPQSHPPMSHSLQQDHTPQSFLNSPTN